MITKHQGVASFDLLAKYIGETSTSLAQKKARLVFADFQRNKIPSPYPLQIQIENFEIPFVNYSNLFSRGKLDIGTRYLLSHIPKGNFWSYLGPGLWKWHRWNRGSKVKPRVRNHIL